MQSPNVQVVHAVEVNRPPAAPAPLRRHAVPEGHFSQAFWRRKGVIFICLIAGLGGGYFHYTRQLETFSARSVVSVFQPTRSTGTGSALESLVDTAPALPQIQAEITSDSVLRKAAESGQLSSFDGAPADLGTLVGWLRSNLSLSTPKDASGRGQTIVHIGFDSTNPLLSTAVVNAVVAAYEEHLSGRHSSAVNRIVDFFQEARDTLLPQLNELEQQYTEFRGTAPLEWTSSGEAINPYRQDVLTSEDTLRRLQSEIRQIDTKLRLIREATMGKSSALVAIRDLQFLLEDVKAVSPAEALDSNLAARFDPEVLIQEQLVPKVIQSELLKRQFGENHPIRKELEEEIAATRRALTDLDRAKQERQTDNSVYAARRESDARNLLTNYVNSLKRKRELLIEDADELEARLAESRKRALALIRFENENQAFGRRIQRLQSMLDSFDSQLEKSNLPSLAQGLQVEILHRSGMGVKTGPLFSRSLVIGLMLGSVLGCALAWLIDWSERTYRDPEEITSTLGLQVLAHLPLMIFRKRKVRKVGDPAAALDSISQAISVVHDPHSTASEAIRAIRTGLLCTKTEQADFQVIQITSSIPGDGKSTVAANLAASLARAQKRVVLVDADLRRPTLHTVYGIGSEESGLTLVLNGELGLEEAILATPIAGLDLLPAGPKPSNPSEALMLPEFGQVLDNLRATYDMVIVDAPPVLACTDASNISSQVDGVIFVMRIARNSKPTSQRALQVLKSLRANVLGIVVNALGDSSYSANYAASWSSRYGYYGSDYGYGYRRYRSDGYLGASKANELTVLGRKRSETPFAKEDHSDVSSAGSGIRSAVPPVDVDASR